MKVRSAGKNSELYRAARPCFLPRRIRSLGKIRRDLSRNYILYSPGYSPGKHLADTGYFGMLFLTLSSFINGGCVSGVLPPRILTMYVFALNKRVHVYMNMR